MKDESPAEEAVITVPAPAKPRRLDCLIMLLVLPLMNGMHFIAIGLVVAAEYLLRAADLPPEFGVLMGVGTWGLFLGVMAVLLHAHQTRWRAATIEPARVILGQTNPPRGVIVRYDQLAGFRCTAAGVVLVLRRKPWTRWLGPLVACDGKLMHDVIERLEAHGVRRIDG